MENPELARYKAAQILRRENDLDAPPENATPMTIALYYARLLENFREVPELRKTVVEKAKEQLPLLEGNENAKKFLEEKIGEYETGSDKGS